MHLYFLVLVIELTGLTNFVQSEGSTTTINKLLDEIENLRSVVLENSKRIEEMRAEREQEKTRNARLEEQVRLKSEELDFIKEVHYRDMNWLRTRLTSTNRLVDMLKRKVTVMQTYQFDNNKLKTMTKEDDVNANTTSSEVTVNSLDNDANVQRRHTVIQGNVQDLTRTLPVEERVAFSASLSTTPTELGREHTIPFDIVTTNIGNGFDTVTHVFICPLKGVYFFHTALSSVYHDYIETELVKDSVLLARMYAAGDARDFPYGFDQGANAVVTTCNKGEHVWVRVREHVGTALSTGEFTTFSGFLLFSL